VLQALRATYPCSSESRTRTTPRLSPEVRQKQALDEADAAEDKQHARSTTVCFPSSIDEPLLTGSWPRLETGIATSDQVRKLSSELHHLKEGRTPVPQDEDRGSTVSDPRRRRVEALVVALLPART
jgi:hypothetical protein